MNASVDSTHSPRLHDASISRIVFWQPIASPHQEAFLEAVARQFTGEVILAVERDLPAERRAQGWRQPSHTNVKVIDISIPANHAALAAHATATSLHVFSGFFSHPLVWAGFRKLAGSEARLAIMSEAPEQTFVTGWLKRLRGKVLAARWAGRFAFVLAIGGVGCEFFERIGFPQEKIVPFGYYLDVQPLAEAAAARRADGVIRFVSAGQLIRRKGIDLLVKACSTLPTAGWRLDIYGDGPERQALERLVGQLQLAERVMFHGVIPSDAVRAVLSEADCAVLPSRFDGWGMLVNESLAVGTPVICTDACGGAAIVKDEQSGCVVPSDRVAPLAAALANAMAKGPVAFQTRGVISQSAFLQATPVRAASRFLGMLAGT
jgi:glycosyltransferase involved in cell wall biosynthesis